MKNTKVSAAALMLAGVLLLTGAGLGGSAYASEQPNVEANRNILETREITIAKGVNIYVDEYPFRPKDANGNSVDRFIYNGTTYLPV